MIFFKKWTTIWSNVKKNKRTAIWTKWWRRENETYARLSEKVKETFVYLTITKYTKQHSDISYLNAHRC
jgi:hypothetical protein